jgi:isocitrate dehydrogenase kinase/phosphatase
LNGQERKEVLRLALDLEKSDDEESRIISIQLIAKMTPDMQEEEAEAFFKTDYLAMYKDSSVRIKK